MKKTMKRVLSLLLVTLLVAVSAIPAFASEAICPGSASVHTTANCSYTEISVKAADCKTAGYIIYACNTCNTEFAVSTPKLTEHNYDENIVPATCESYGYITRYCSTCGDISSTKLEKLGHDYKYTWKDDDGEICKPGSEYKIRTCRNCGDYDKNGTVTGHTWMLVEVLEEPTCLAAGLAVYECQECGDKIESVINATGGHTAKLLGIISKPTCEEDGVARYFCEDCDKTFEAAYSAVGHDWTYVEAQEQSCTKDLILATDQKCANCGVLADATGTIYSEEELELRAATHTWGATTIEKQATCTAKGKEFRACSVCGVEEVIITDALGHIEATNVGYAANCNHAGRTDEVYCVTCGEILSAAKELPVLDHVYIETGRTWSDGDLADIETVRCGKSIKITSECKYCGQLKEIFTKLPEHKYSVVVVEPTCSTKGYSAYICEYCELEDPAKEHFNETAINTNKHTYPELGNGSAIGDPATCTKAGRETVVCLDCGKGEHERAVPAYKHDFYEVSSDYMTDGELMAKYGTFVTRVNGTGTCLVQTEYKLICKRCNDPEEAIIVKIKDGSGNGHTKDTRVGYTAAKASTCTQPGNTEGWTCSNAWCTNPYNPSEIIPAIHNDLVNGMKLVKGVEATCFENGTIEYYVCPLGRNCTSYDKETKLPFICDVSGNALVAEDLVVDMLEHVLVNKGTADASCTDNGYAVYVCELCDSYIETADFEAMHEHNYGSKSVMDSCENGKWQIRICKDCGKIDAVQERPAGHVVVFNGVVNELTNFCGDLNESRVCTVCKTVILKEDHVYGNWTLKDNILVRNCVACGNEDTQEHNDHTWVENEKTEEVITFVCICGETKEEAVETTPVETDTPETDMPETDAPETDTPETSTPETDVPDVIEPKPEVKLGVTAWIMIIGFILVIGLVIVLYFVATKKKAKF